MAPSDKSFSARNDGRISGDVKLRLEEYRELLFADGGLEIRTQLLFEQDLLEDLVIEIIQVIVVVSLKFVVCHAGPDEPVPELQILVDLLVDAHLKLYTAEDKIDSMTDILELFSVVFSMVAVDEEQIHFLMAEDGLILGILLFEFTGDKREQLDALFLAVAFEKNLIVVDAQNDRVHVRFRMILVERFSIFVEVFAVIKARDDVVLGVTDYLTVFGKLYGSVDPGLNDALPRIGLRDEV